MRDFMYSLLFLICATAIIVYGFLFVDNKITERKRTDKILYEQNTAPKFLWCRMCSYAEHENFFKNGHCPRCGYKVNG